jgi:formamidopyrimidine-DNA glycosylase
MPELPEVETMRMQLNKFLPGHKIISVEVNNRRVFEGDEKLLVGAKFVKARRFGKVGVLDLDNGYSILTHVKLTGQFIYRGPNLKIEGNLSKKVVGGVPGPHTLVVFTLDNAGVLYYNDIRRFGWIRIEKTENVENEKFIKSLGPEPHVAKGFAGQALTFDYFANLLSKSKRNIKVLLMDQTKIGGVGNIYANDALWLSQISPKRTANTLSGNETAGLYNAIETVLKAGLKYGGASELAFVTPDGNEGQYQDHSLVYGHQGQLCTNCKTNKIEKFFLGGRGTYWCPNCQK